MPVYNAPLPIDIHVPLSATLIYDGGREVHFPRQLLPKGEVRKGPEQTLVAQMDAGTVGAYTEAMELVKTAGQDQGTLLEVLCEMAGRCCYDSYGRGRNSADFHKHILEVGHLSVLEHAAFTVRIEASADTICSWALVLLNRPCVHVEIGAVGPLSDQYSFLEVTVNLRHVLEWDRHVQQDRFGRNADHKNRALGRILRHHAHSLAPQIVSAGDPLVADEVCNALVEPTREDQQWVTMLLTGSRGFSHELVRHGDWTAISQRSTRYVDESESPWVEHPLEQAYNDENGEQHYPSGDRVIVDAQNRYKLVVRELEPWLIARGVDKVSARKQARGAARGYLGNALYTEVVFSANIRQWKLMLRQRFSPFADAEIREVFRQVLMELKRSRYASSFEGWGEKPAPDGIGHVLVEPTTSTP
jgi:thymidylate synthase ThyX